jgi:hypothetical protein
MSYAPPSIRKRGVRNAERGIKVRRDFVTPHSAFLAAPKLRADGRTPHSPDVFMKRFHICLDCPWNLNWTCQHAGCAFCPGKQKQIGADPLKQLLAEPFFKCPLNKF